MASQAQAQAKQDRRFGWKSYAFVAVVAAISAGKLRRQLKLKLKQPQQPQNESKWYSPSEADLRQEKLDEIEQKERVARVQEAYESLKSNYRHTRTTSRYQKWEEHPKAEEDAQEKSKKDSTGRATIAERTRLRHHYLVLGLDPLRDEGFSQEEIKASFRERALQFHPDKNPENREETRVKFRELMDSYKAIKSVRKIS